MDKKAINLGYIIVILLLLNTFFLAGIWCSVKMACGKSSAGWCPFSRKDSANKFCPIPMAGSPQNPSATP